MRDAVFFILHVWRARACDVLISRVHPDAARKTPGVLMIGSTSRDYSIPDERCFSYGASRASGIGPESDYGRHVVY